MADWSELPLDIVNNFATRISPYVEEFVVFNCVCKTWRSAAVTAKSRLKPFAPCLLIANKEYDDMADDDDEERIRSFYSLYSKKFFNLRLPTQGKKCWETPYGWLVTLGQDLKINLLNPFTKTQIALPPTSTFHDVELDNHAKHEEIRQNFGGKFIFASNPSYWNTTPPPSHLVVAIYGAARRLAFATPEDKAWTTLDQRVTEDVIFFNGHFYAVSSNGALRICDIDTTPRVTNIASPPDGVLGFNSFYLVDISKNLHLVERSILSEGDADYHVNTLAFKVFMLDFNKSEWVKVKDFHDYALFIGNSVSFAISSSEYTTFKGNCIYFTDDHYESYDTGFCDMGVYDYEKGTSEKFYSGHDQVSIFSRPVFFMPSL
ncbi:SWR1-complex protein 3 [Ranunculus cassubicifolius]